MKRLLFQNRKAVLIFCLFLMYRNYTYAQVPVQQFWLQNQVLDSLAYDNIASNGVIDNGSGNWDVTSFNWLHTQKSVLGTENTQWPSSQSKCFAAIFGGNPGVGNAGTVTLLYPVTNVKSITFKRVIGGNFILTGQSITPCATRFNIFTANGVNATISSIITGTTGIIKTGSGTLNLNGPCTYTNTSVINSGTVNLANGISLGIGGDVINNGIVQYDCSQYAQNVTNNFTTVNGTTNGTVTQSVIALMAPGQSGIVAAGTLNLFGNITQYGISGYGCATINIQSGNVHVSYISTGKNNSYGAPGFLIVTNSTLTVDNYLTSGEISGTGVNGGAIQATFNSGAVVYAKGFYANNANYGGASKITVNDGAIFLTGSNNIAVRTYNLDVVLNGGTIGCWNANTTMTATSCTLNASTASTLNTNMYNYSLNTVVSGSGALIKSGSGTLFLNGNNTYTGGITINNGMVTAGNVNAFGTGTITVNAGATLKKNGFAISNTIVNNGGTVLP